MPMKFLVLGGGGGIWFVFGEGGSANFIFVGALSDGEKAFGPGR